MGMLIFFGMALFVFLLGVTVMSVTFYHWFKEYRQSKIQAAVQKKLAETGR